MKNAPGAKIEIQGMDEFGQLDEENPWAGTVVVEAGYYGLVEIENDGTPKRVGWVVEFAGDRANAERIVRNEKVIGRIVRENGGRKRVAVSFSPRGGSITVRDYDNSEGFSVTRKAVR